MLETLLPIVTTEDEQWCRANYDKVFALAVKLHAKQTDRGGTSYIVHLHYVATRQGTYAGRVVGLLHDSLEDNRITEPQLYQFGLPVSIVARIRLMSRRPDEPYMDYIRRAAVDTIVRGVKRTDLEHNMDLTRLPHIAARDLARLEKYHQAYRLLQEHR